MALKGVQVAGEGGGSRTRGPEVQRGLWVGQRPGYKRGFSVFQCFRSHLSIPRSMSVFPGPKPLGLSSSVRVGGLAFQLRVFGPVCLSHWVLLSWTRRMEDGLTR